MLKKAALYNFLQTDTAVNDYLRNQEDNTSLFEEISRRDIAYEKGEMRLTTIEEPEESLNENGDAV